MKEEKEKREIFEQNRAYYQEIAPCYDQGREAFFSREERRIGRDLRRIISKKNMVGMTVVDIGCGTGLYSLIAAANGGEMFHCVDLNQTFLQAASNKLKSHFPGVKVICHEADLEGFLVAEGEILETVDLVIMGSVLQYIPNCNDLVKRMAKRLPNTCFYIASTPLELKGNWIEELLAMIDYQLYCLFRGGPARGTTGQQLITLPVEYKQLEKIFIEHGFQVHSYRYRTFHTALIDRFYASLLYLFPNLASRFSLIAW